MSDDAKVDFYLKHRVLIEEWAALRAPAVSVLRLALLEEAQRLFDEDGPVDNILEPSSKRGPTYVQMPVTHSPLPRVHIEWSWDERKLLERSHWRRWPILAVVVTTDPPEGLWDVVASAVSPLRLQYGLSERGRSRWPWWGRLSPQSEPIDPDAFAVECGSRASSAWRELQPVISGAVQGWHGASTQDKPTQPRMGSQHGQNSDDT